MTDSKSSSSGGISVLGLLGVVFVTLKLCGVIDWSWWWVTAPFWGGFALLLAALLVVGLFAGCVFLFEKLTSR
jgi:hypothetical protein